MYDKPIDKVHGHKRHREFLLNTDYINNGVQHRYKFSNDYGASVVKHDFSYGGQNGLWELAVLDFTVDKTGEITYHTPITQDVVGHLAWDNVESILQEIKEL
jgi:hypothetical protein